MATGSDFAWPSVTVKRGSTVVKGRSIVKCSWSDNFGILLEKVGSEFSAEVVIQVVISKNEKLDTTHTVPLDAPVKLLETYGCLYVCYYLADNTVRETSQESPNALTILMQRVSQRVLPPVCQSPSSGSEQLRGDQVLRNDVIGYLQERNVGWSPSVVSTSGEQLVKTLTAALWYLDPHHKQFEDR